MDGEDGRQLNDLLSDSLVMKIKTKEAAEIVKNVQSLVWYLGCICEPGCEVVCRIDVAMSFSVMSGIYGADI